MTTMYKASLSENVAVEQRPMLESVPTTGSFLPADSCLHGTPRRRKAYDSAGNLAGIWPDEFRDQVALIACLLITPIIAYFELYVVADYNAQHGSSTVLNTILCVFFAFNFYGNLYKLMRTNPSDEQSSLPSIQRSGYRYCSTCKCNAPPRAYHCPICNFCVWKRDHHCAFAGVCVGYFNHRYYFLTVAYAFISCLYGCWWNTSYLSHTVGGFRLGTIWYCIMPHIALLTRFIGFSQFISIMGMMLVVACMIITGYFLGAQIFCLARGQTRPEYLLGIRMYDRGGFLANLHEVLGRRWLLAVLCPLLPSPMLGDGQRFAVRGRVEPDSVKDL